MATIYDEILMSSDQITLKSKIWTEIISRLGEISNGCTLGSGMLRRIDKPILIPAKRPSSSKSSRSEYHLGLYGAFVEPVPLIQAFKLGRGTRMFKLVGLAIGLFEEARRVGNLALKYAEEIEDKLNKQLKAKGLDNPTLLINREEYADYQKLAIFVCERQFGLINSGLSDPGPGPSQVKGPAFATIHYSTTVWSGKAPKVEKVLAFIDGLLEDTKKSDPILKQIQKLKKASADLNLGKSGIQLAYQKLADDESGDVERDPTKLCYSTLCHSVFFGEKDWIFHNGAQVVKVIIDSYLAGMREIHINEILAGLPKKFEGQHLSQIFKNARKDAAWKDLIIDGTSGKGFYRLNPIYLENGVKEIILGRSSQKTPKDKSS